MISLKGSLCGNGICCQTQVSTHFSGKHCPKVPAEDDVRQEKANSCPPVASEVLMAGVMAQEGGMENGERQGRLEHSSNTSPVLKSICACCEMKFTGLLLSVTFTASYDLCSQTFPAALTNLLPVVQYRNVQEQEEHPGIRVCSTFASCSHISANTYLTARV